MNTEIQQAEAKFEVLQAKNHDVIDSAQALQVVDDTTYEQAVSIGLEANRRIKVVQLEFSEPKAAAHKAWKAISALETKLLEPLEAIKKLMSSKSGAYHAEKLRKEREAEELRLAEERKRIEEAALASAQKLEEAGDVEGAQQIVEAAISPTAVIPQAVTGAPKVNGVSQRTVWKYRVVDEKAVPREFLCVDETKLGKYTRAMGASAKVAGVEFYPETTTAFGGGR
jgi:hypothetical protein